METQVIGGAGGESIKGEETVAVSEIIFGGRETPGVRLFKLILQQRRRWGKEKVYF